MSVILYGSRSFVCNRTTKSLVIAFLLTAFAVVAILGAAGGLRVYATSEPAYCTTLQTNGASWDSTTSTCTFTGSILGMYTVSSGTLEITSGTTLLISSTPATAIYITGGTFLIDSGATVIDDTTTIGIYNHGGTFTNDGTVTIQNTLGTAFEIYNGGTTTNSGTFTIQHSGGLGLAILSSGNTFTNTGTVNDDGSVSNSGGTISSTGTWNLQCDGSSPSGFTGTITNDCASTTTSVSCTPSPVNVGSASTCTASVVSSSATGTITFSTSVGSSTQFSSTTCTLSSGSCQVTFTPAASTSPVTITASYGGATTFAASSNTFSLSVSVPSVPEFPILQLSIPLLFLAGILLYLAIRRQVPWLSKLSP